MGNNSTRESRGQDSPTSQNRLRPESSGGAPDRPNSPNGRQPGAVYGVRTGARSSRPDLSMFGIGSGSNNSEVPERRETKQEREARRLEKERVARVKERERSIKEEHVDGGYLVTMGVYTGTEDFHKTAVRQLMIERRVAPFWRGLNDFKEEWAEHQLVAAGRGLPIPAADEVPEEVQDPTVSAASDSPHASDPNLQNLMPPISSRSQSAASDASGTLAIPSPTSTNPFNSSPATPTTPSASPFRPRTRILASLTTSSKNPSPVDIVPREIQLPKDPYVNGQAIEVFLYKDATECPICFLYYPPYLNKTRCCDQPICSECFVQIKRPDPHPPEHETNDPSNPTPPNPEPAAEAEALVSEPACCPYCQLPEFGVTYEAPPFRRGLSYANPQGLEVPPSAAPSPSPTAMSGTPTTLAPHTHKRRAKSISASAPTVITTDRIRPDWAVKLANARSHIARRSAAATALHTAAYLMGNGSTDNRGFTFGSRGRFGRNRGENSPVPSGTATPSAESNARTVAEQIVQMRREAQEPGTSGRRGRMDDLEEMMMIEAIKLSLEAEEERKKKVEKDAAKDARKRAKEEKKKEKKERKGVYGSGASSAGGSTLSLSLSGFGRRRGNSGASNLGKEVTSDSVDYSRSKGKAADRDIGGASVALAPINTTQPDSSTAQDETLASRNLEGGSFPSLQESHDSPITAGAPDRPSHLRQMSNASSLTSSFVESVPNSPRDGALANGSWSSPSNAVGANVNSNGLEVGDTNSNSGINIRSLATVISVGDEDNSSTMMHAEQVNPDNKDTSTGLTSQTLKPRMEEGVSTLTGDDSNAGEHQTGTPGLIVTPGTPATASDGEEFGKQLGADMAGGAERVLTQ